MGRPSSTCFPQDLVGRDANLFSVMAARMVSRGMYAPMLAWWLEYFDPS